MSLIELHEGLFICQVLYLGRDTGAFWIYVCNVETSQTSQTCTSAEGSVVRVFPKSFSDRLIVGMPSIVLFVGKPAKTEVCIKLGLMCHSHSLPSHDAA